MSDPSIEKLLGSPAKPRARVEIGPAPDIEDIFRGVTVSWLMQAFRLDRSTVKKKLADLTPLKYDRGNIPIYDFVQAAEYLVKPKVDLLKYIKTLRPEDLPNELQKDYWDALLKRQRWEEKAGQLWRTEDVIEVFGEAFKHIKASTQLWSTTLERRTALSDEQRNMLQKMTDRLLSDMHRRLCEMQEKRQTGSVADQENDDGV